MLENQDFQHRPEIWLGPDMFLLPIVGQPDIEICHTLRDDEQLRSIFAVQLFGLESQAETLNWLSDILSMPVSLLLPDKPTEQTHRTWRFMCRTCFCIYSPSVVSCYRHRSPNVLVEAPPLQVMQALASLVR